MESLVIRFLLTMLVALVCGLAAVRLGVPVGGLVGGLFGVAIFNIITGMAYSPDLLKLFTQSMSGAYIGMRIKKSDLPEFKNIISPAVIMLVGLVIFNLSLGIGIAASTNMDLMTSLLSTTPGGVTEISLMSADMGANQAQVTLMHLLRLIMVMGTFPILLKKLATRFDGERVEEAAANGSHAAVDSGSFPLTVLIGLIGGGIGYISGLPAGTLAFSMVFVATFGVKTDRAFVPGKYRKYVQMLAGLIIGKGVGLGDILQIPDIFLPAVIMLVAYLIMNIGLSYLIAHYTKMNYTTALFATSPAGASDMALMALELGGDAPKVACMQLVRVLATIIVFPPIIQLTVTLLGG